MRSKNKQEHEDLFRDTIKKLGIIDITSEIGIIKDNLDQNQREIFLNKMRGQDNFYISYEKDYSSMKLFTFNNKRAVIYDMGTNLCLILDDNLKKIATLKSGIVETKYFQYELKRNFKEELKDSVFKYKFIDSNKVSYMYVYPTNDFVFSSTTDHLKESYFIHSIAETDSEYVIRFSNSPYGSISLDKNLNILNIKINNKLAIELEIHKEKKIHTTISSFNESYSDLYELYNLKTDLKAHNSNNVVSELDFESDYNFIKSLIRNKQKIINNKNEVLDMLLPLGFLEVKNSYKTTELKENVKKYKIEPAFVNYKNQSMVMVSKYRNLMSIFFQMKDNKFKFIMNDTVDVLKKSIEKTSMIIDFNNLKLQNKKSKVK